MYAVDVCLNTSLSSSGSCCPLAVAISKQELLIGLILTFDVDESSGFWNATHAPWSSHTQPRQCSGLGNSAEKGFLLQSAYILLSSFSRISERFYMTSSCSIRRPVPSAGDSLFQQKRMKDSGKKTVSQGIVTKRTRRRDLRAKRDLVFIWAQLSF